MVPDPDGPVTSGEYGPDVVCTEPLMYRETDNWNAAETIDTLGRGQPQVTFFVFEKALDRIAGEAIRAGKMIHVAIVNPVDAGFVSRNPQCVTPVQPQAANPQLTAVECRHGECFPGTIYPLFQPQPAARPGNPDPRRSIRS